MLLLTSAQSRLTLCNPMVCNPPGSFEHEIFPGENAGLGCHFLLQRIFPTQGSNPGLLRCRQMLYRLSHQVQLLGQEDPLEKGMATHSSILAWRIPWTEETGRLQSMGLQRVGHD